MTPKYTDKSMTITVIQITLMTILVELLLSSLWALLSGVVVVVVALLSGLSSEQFWKR